MGFLRPIATCSLALALIAVPARAQNDEHRAYHQAIELWIDGDATKAITTIEEGVRDASLGDDTRATLYDLGSRILFAKAMNGVAGPERIATLECAEYDAARAVSIEDSDLTFWRDYMAIAEAARGSARVLDTLRRAWHYKGSVAELYTLTTTDQRVIAMAATETLHGRDLDAVARLEKHITENNGESCSPRIILAELDYDLDRAAASQSVLAAANDVCRSRFSAVALTRRILSAETTGDRFSRVTRSDDAKVSRDGRPTVEIPPYSETVVVRAYPPNTVDEHRADAEDAVLRDPSRLKAWYTLWAMLQFNGARQREYENVLKLARRLNPAWQIEVACLYSELGRGQFEQARNRAERLLRKHPSDSHLNAALVLAGSALGGGANTYRPALDLVRSSNPYLAGCLDAEEINLCLTRNNQCVLGAIVCRGSQDFVLEAFDQGWSHGSQLRKYFDRKLSMESLARINGGQRLREEMIEHSAEQDERLDALRSRIDVAIVPTMERLKRSIANTEDRQSQLERALDQERRDARARIEKMARDYSHLIKGIKDQAAMTQGDIAHLSLRLAADEVALNGPSVDHMVQYIPQYAREHPYDAAAIAKSITDQVRATVHSQVENAVHERVTAAIRADGDTTEMFKDIFDACGSVESQSAPCLRSVIKMAKKHIQLQVPIVPTFLSVDVLGVCDTVLEVMDMIFQASGLSPAKSAH